MTSPIRQVARSGKHTDLLTATVFRLDIDSMPTVNFSELGNITMEMKTGEYQAVGAKAVEHAKLMGQIVPPTLTLKRGLDKDFTIWSWFQLAMAGSEAAYKTCTLKFYGPGDSASGPGRMQYILQNALPTKLDVNGTKAGTADLVLMSFTMICDNIIDPNAKPFG